MKPQVASPRRLLAASLVAGWVGVAVFLAWSAATYRLGFPLDDAWIHQTYARNLANTGDWAFIPGEASGGSTAPLWTFFLAIGHWASFDPRAWAYVLGTSLLAVLGVLTGLWLRRDDRLASGWVVLGAVLVVLEWHLVWSAASGMEAIALAALVVAVILLAGRPPLRPVVLGALIGVGVWVRPDAITLLVIPAVVIVGARDRSPRQRMASAAALGLGAALPFGVYLLFNLATAGSAWPSTYYSKQAEYAFLGATPFFNRFLRLGVQPLIGAGVLLFPAAVGMAVEAGRRRDWSRLAPAIWAIFYLAIYSARLPVTYQHGRYQVPIVPVIILLGWEGIGVAHRNASTRRQRLLTTAWAAATLAVGAGFVALGARAYATDVAIIETEMVETAQWINARTEAEAVVAAHDIGALGYFGGRDVLDLAGLTDPEAIPIVRDEPALGRLLADSGADYLMTFPGWYPRLASCGELVYLSDGEFSPEAGGENMAVYRWPVVGPEGCMLYSP